MLRQVLSPLRIAAKNISSNGSCSNLGGFSQNLGVSGFLTKSSYHTSSVLLFGRKLKKISGSKFDQKPLSAEGEDSALVQRIRPSQDKLFPDVHTPTQEFNGIMFKDLPILNVKAAVNNTIMNVTDSKGVTQMLRTCGMDGFKHARKGTNVAAQATGFSLGKKMMQRGYRTVRARIQGLGPGRMSSLRGLTLAGVNIISVTDNTPVSANPPRARKQRRV